MRVLQLIGDIDISLIIMGVASLGILIVGLKMISSNREGGPAISSAGLVILFIALLNTQQIMSTVGIAGKIVVGVGLVVGILGVAKYRFPSL